MSARPTTSAEATPAGSPGGTADGSPAKKKSKNPFKRMAKGLKKAFTATVGSNPLGKSGWGVGVGSREGGVGSGSGGSGGPPRPVIDDGRPARPGSTAMFGRGPDGACLIAAHRAALDPAGGGASSVWRGGVGETLALGMNKRGWEDAPVSGPPPGSLALPRVGGDRRRHRTEQAGGPPTPRRLAPLRWQRPSRLCATYLADSALVQA